MDTNLSPQINRDIAVVIQSLQKAYGWETEDKNVLYTIINKENTAIQRKILTEKYKHEKGKFFSQIIVDKKGKQHFDSANFIRLYLILMPELLWHGDYRNTDKKEAISSGYRIWIKISFSCENDDDFLTIIKFLKKQLFPKMSIKPFHDEDAIVGHFSKKEVRHGFIYSSFYINPDFAEGCWENHAI